jgi:hypothetical protein
LLAEEVISETVFFSIKLEALNEPQKDCDTLLQMAGCVTAIVWLVWLAWEIVERSKEGNVMYKYFYRNMQTQGL